MRRAAEADTVRQCTDVAPDAVDQLVRRRPEVEAVIKQTLGFAHYDLIRTQGGMTSVTVCADQAGAEDCNTRVAAWVKANMSALLPTPPQIVPGEDVIHVAAGA